jgi:hypothetical protein
MECICWNVKHSHWIGGDWKGNKKRKKITHGSIIDDFIIENNINSIEVHSLLRNNGHIMDGTVVGTCFLKPF